MKLSLPILLLILCELGVAAPFSKKVTIHWEPVPDSSGYELELTTRAGTSRIFSFEADTTSWSHRFQAGSYQYRIRAIDWIHRTGEWSETQSFDVFPAAPVLVSPEAGALLPYVDNGEVALSWQPSDGAQSYRVEILKEGTVTESVETDKTSLKLGKQPGKYSWRVSAHLKNGAMRDVASDTSETREFEMGKIELTEVKGLRPIGRVQPDGQGLNFVLRWDAVPAAAAYEVKIDGRTFVALGPSINIRVPDGREYRVEVAALASRVGDIYELKGPPGSARFRVDRYADYADGKHILEVAVGSGEYDQVQKPSDAFFYQHKSLPATWLEFGLRSWLGSHFEAYFDGQRIGGQTQGADTELYRFGLGFGVRGAIGPPSRELHVSLRLGISGKEYYEVIAGGTPLNPIYTPIYMGALGPTLLFQLRKDFSDRFSFSATVRYFQPVFLIGQPDYQLDDPWIYPNVETQLEAQYWIDPKWGWALGVHGLYDSLHYRAAGDTIPSTLNLLGVSYYGRIIFRLNP